MSALKQRWDNCSLPFPAVLQGVNDGRSLAELGPPKHGIRHDLRFVTFAPGSDLTKYDFSRCDLEGAVFDGCVLNQTQFGECHLSDASFIDADLTNAQLMSACLKNANFQRAICDGASFYGASLNDANFDGARMNDANLENCILRGVSLGNIILRHVRGFLGKGTASRIRDEQIGDWQGATDVYFQLRQALEAAGERTEAGEMFYKWRCCRRHTLPRGLALRDFLSWAVMGYGERPLRVLVASVMIILLSAFFYAMTGLYVLGGDSGQVTRNGENGSEVASKISNTESRNMVASEAVYFSLVTFTTLGYGDALPNLKEIEKVEKTFPDWLQGFFRATVLWTPAAEAVVGACFIALFTVSVARKIIRE